MKALDENETYELTTVPEGRKVIGGKWVYAKKMASGDQERYKARYVARGFSQVPGIDYSETFSPTARHASIRALMQVAVQYGLTVHQMDVKTAYLNADIDCDLFVEQPKGFEKTNEKGEKLVWKLKKSLYGLKQSGRNWNQMLSKKLIENGFKQSISDSCLYTKIIGNEIVILLLWVDDIIIAASSDDEMESTKSMLSENFKMKDMGQLNWFLGSEFKFSDDSISINQKRYCEKILSRFGLENCKPRSIPCDQSVVNMSNCDSDLLEDPTVYREIVGSLIYLMIFTRPDLCYVVTKLSQYMSKPTKAHLGIAKHVLRYVKGTIDFCLKFEKCQDSLSLIGYSDSDWGSSTDRHSISGYVFMLNPNGGLISWKCKKQRCIALSSCEAEYVSTTNAVQEGIWLRQIYADMIGQEVDSFDLNVDNQGAIELAKNPVHHQRTKHIDIRYHYIRFCVEKEIVHLVYVPTNDNLADMFTKPMSTLKLRKFNPIVFGCRA